MSSLDLGISLVEIHSVYLYMGYKNCVGSLIFRRPRVLTNCASYDTLAKPTTPGHIYKHLKPFRDTPKTLYSNHTVSQRQKSVLYLF